MTPNQENLLWDYADGLLSLSEQRHVEALLANDPALKKGLEGILLKKNAFSSLSLAQTPASFATNVLAAWQQEQLETVYVPQKNWIIRGITLAFTLLLLAGLILICWIAPTLPSISLPTITSTLLSRLPTIAHWIQPLVLLLLGGLTANFVEQLWVVYGQPRKFA